LFAPSLILPSEDVNFELLFLQSPALAAGIVGLAKPLHRGAATHPPASSPLFRRAFGAVEEGVGWATPV